MEQYRYVLEKGSKKHYCPECGKRRFVRYIDTQTGGYLPEQYGRCDRESKCGYFLNPYKDGYTKSVWERERSNKIDWRPTRTKSVNIKKRPLDAQKQPFFYPLEVLNRTCAGYKQNVFIQNLLARVPFPFEVQDIEKVVSLYRLGTVQNGYRKGANTFPFIDIGGNIRTIQVKQFNEQNHTTSTDFLHSIIEKHHNRAAKPLPEWLEAYNKNELKVSCLFGEHLLSEYPRNPVALVEAPKSAVYGALYFGFPERDTELLWLAVYNLSSLNLDKCRVLKGRRVYLFPDLSKDGKAFALWRNKANEMQKRLKGTYFQVSDLLEQSASSQDKEQGKDIADYLIRLDWRPFRRWRRKTAPQPKPKPKPFQASIPKKSEAPKKPLPLQPKPLPKVEVFRPEPPEGGQPENWDKDILELENYFAGVVLPTEPLRVNKWTTILSCKGFIEGHLSTVKAHNGNKTFYPYLKRLWEFKEVLSQIDTKQKESANA